MRPISGLLNIAKPSGITSRAVVDRVQALVGRSKAGHAGTLDPLASGVLVVCVGAATRLIPFVQEGQKSYRAEFLLGRRSDTDDITGTVVETACEPVSQERILAALPQFQGTISQVPPQFSAVHVAGKRAHELARAGRDVVLTPRTVQIDRIQFVTYEWPRLILEIDCGSGTYIRSIGRDLGEQLGCGAVMSALERTRIGPFTQETALAFESLDRRTLHESIQPLTAALAHLPRTSCTDQEAADFRMGRSIPRDPALTAAPDERYACLDDRGDLVAIVAADPLHPVWRPKLVIPLPKQSHSH